MQSFQDVTLRGHGNAAFVFAKNKGRSVEISHHEGNLWLEFWEAGCDETASPVQELSVEKADQAIEKAAQWLR